MTEVAAMQEKNLHVRVVYSTDCPEWWRIMVGRRLGKRNFIPATRAECVEWLRRYGQSEDDNLALAWQQMQDAIAAGEEVES